MGREEHALAPRAVPRRLHQLSPDLVFISHGHNEGHTVPAEPYWRDDLLALTESFSLLSPASELVLIAQNPRTADDSMDARQYVTQSVAQMRGYGFVNVWRAFHDASPGGVVVQDPAPGALIDTDGVHPNAAGQRVWADAVERQLVLVPGAVSSQQPSSLSVPVPNLLSDGDFAQLLGGSSQDWTVAGAVSKDTTHFEGPSGFALHLTGACPRTSRTCRACAAGG